MGGKVDPWFINPPPAGSQVVAMFHSSDRSRYAMIQTLPGFDGPDMPEKMLSEMLSTFTENSRMRKKLHEQNWTEIKKIYAKEPVFSGTNDPDKEIQSEVNSIRRL